MSNSYSNAVAIEACMKFLEQLLSNRLKTFFIGQPFNPAEFDTQFLNEFKDSNLIAFKNHYRLNDAEFVIVLLALFPHAAPSLLDNTVRDYMPNGGELIEIGGTRGLNHRGMLPTMQTFLFLVAGGSIAEGIVAREFFTEKSILMRERIIRLGEYAEVDPFTTAPILLDEDYIELFLTGNSRPISAGNTLVAQPLTSHRSWSDLVVEDETIAGFTEITNWIKNRNFTKTKSGYKALLYGKTGTGKSMAATLLGKQIDLPVIQVNLTLIISKYIGETEKAIEQLFDRAERKNWILFFDEADALFGKNQNQHTVTGVAYLRKRMEVFPGLLLFEAKSLDSFSEDFLQKLKTIIHFPLPTLRARKKLWEIHFPEHLRPEYIELFDEFAERFPLPGSEIQDACERLSILAADKEDRVIRANDITTVLQRMGKQRITNHPKVIKIFVSYSSRDRMLRKLLVEGLQSHLQAKEGLTYEFWADKQIDVGADWKKEIDGALKNSNVALLLVSANFASSDFIQTNELSEFFKRRDTDNYAVLPVLIRSFDFKRFEKLSFLNFFKTYYPEYGYDTPDLRHELMPFDYLGENANVKEQQLQGYYYTLADHIHTAMMHRYMGE